MWLVVDPCETQKKQKSLTACAYTLICIHWGSTSWYEFSPLHIAINFQLIYESLGIQVVRCSNLGYFHSWYVWCLWLSWQCHVIIMWLSLRNRFSMQVGMRIGATTTSSVLALLASSGVYNVLQSRRNCKHFIYLAIKVGCTLPTTDTLSCPPWGGKAYLAHFIMRVVSVS